MAGAQVAVLLAAPFVRIAIGNLVTAIGGQASLLWNFSKDLEEMRDHLETILAVLVDAERQSVHEEMVQLWLKRLKHAAMDISDMLEDYQDRSDQASAKMPGVLSCLPTSYKKIVMANRMKSLREKLRKIVKEVAFFNLKMGSITNNEQSYDERETMSYLPEEPIIGRDGEKKEIMDLLSANTNNDDGTRIVAIYGLGGLGKSTLAKLVYNDTQFKKYDYRIWVYVSQDFSLNKIGRSIISQLPTQDGQQNMGTQQEIKQHLDKLLHSKTVLVVLDDLWQEKMAELGKLRTILHVECGKIDVIVTTRNEEIAIKVSTISPYKLQRLEDDKCWEIIKRFSKFELKSNQVEMEQVGLDIAKKCGGVALAAQAVGFMLGSIDDLSGWTNINNSDIWNGYTEASDVLPSLKLSYERMAPQLRICFSYCAIFPKGHNIIEDDLVQHWIALGFIEQSKGKECINKLLGMSFLQVSKLPSASGKHVMRYTMHDLVHDLAKLTVADEFKDFSVAPPRNTQAHKYCRYSLLRKYDPKMKLTNMPSKIRALCLSDSGELLDIPSGSFSFAKCLRTLDFSGCSGILLPASIGELKQLRCLIAPRMQNGTLPKCVTELSQLQYLNMNESSKITELPESIGNLECLKCLHLSSCSGISKLPQSFGDLKCMIHLDMSGCAGIMELPLSLGNLTNLQHLELSGCSNLKAIPESLCGLTQLQYLNLSSCDCLDRIPEAIGSLIDLKYLNMSYCRQIKELPESLMKLQKLLHLDLSSCRGIRRGPLGCLRGLTRLQHLDMSHLRSTNYLQSQVLSDVLGHLTSLKYLRLKNSIMNGLGSFIGGLTNLEHLDLSMNFDLACLPESIGNLQRLHTLDLTGSWLKSLPNSMRALQLKSLMLDACSDEVLDQASSLVNYSQTLPVFKVRADEANGCSNLHVLEHVHACELKIRCLENVMSLEEANKVKLLDKHNLSELTVHWNKDAVRHLEDKDLLGQLVPPKGLKSIFLKGYISASFPCWFMGISDHLTNLVSISLSDLPTCSVLPPLGRLQHLERLSLEMLPRIKRIDSELLCGGKGAFRRLSSFDVSFMLGLEEWNTTYSVENGVEEFMFPALDSLMIEVCPRLRLKPCPPTFRVCYINSSDQVIFSLEDIDEISHHCSSSIQAIKFELCIRGDSCQRIRLFHHFPALRDLCIKGARLMRLPESMRQLTFLQSLTLHWCQGILELPEWLGELSSLKSIVIWECEGIKYLPSCIQQLPKLQKLEIHGNLELKEWCELEENKTKFAHINVQFFEDSF